MDAPTISVVLILIVVHTRCEVDEKAVFHHKDTIPWQRLKTDIHQTVSINGTFRGLTSNDDYLFVSVDDVIHAYSKDKNGGLTFSHNIRFPGVSADNWRLFNYDRNSQSIVARLSPRSLVYLHAYVEVQGKLSMQWLPLDSESWKSNFYDSISSFTLDDKGFIYVIPKNNPRDIAVISPNGEWLGKYTADTGLSIYLLNFTIFDHTRNLVLGLSMCEMTLFRFSVTYANNNVTLQLLDWTHFDNGNTRTPNMFMTVGSQYEYIFGSYDENERGKCYVAVMDSSARQSYLMDNDMWQCNGKNMLKYAYAHRANELLYVVRGDDKQTHVDLVDIYCYGC